ncbi:MAG: TonB-dependent receptor [Chitinophagaceae bacterium]
MSKIRMVVGLLLMAFVTNAQGGFPVAGSVTNENNMPIGKAIVSLLNTGFETLTDKEGRFLLTDVPRGNYQLSVSAEGAAAIIRTLEVTAAVNDLTIRLESRALSLANLVVTSQKREESGRMLPLSISVLDAQRIRELRLWNSRDLTAVVPNLYSANPGDGRNVTSIRGITSTSYDPAVTTYIDGVAQFNLDTYIPQLFDVERIEVLRGPQGSLYGRNAMGGVINIISKQPGNRTDGFAELSAGNKGIQRYTAGVRTSLIRDHLFAGVAGLYEKSDGFYRNLYDGKKFDRQHTLAGNYWLKYLSGRKWKAELNVKHLAAANHGAFPLAGSWESAMEDPYTVNQNATTRLVDRTFNSSLSFVYTFPNFSLTSQTAYQSNYRYYRSPIDGDFSPIDGITIINNYGRDFNRVRAFTQELRLTSNRLTSLRWTAGLYLFTQRSPNKQATHFGEDAVLVGSPDINYAIIATNATRNRGAALFGQADKKLGRKWMVTGGLRIDRQFTSSRILGQYLPDGAPEPVFDTQADTSASRNYTALSPKLSLSYFPSASTNLYVSYARGFRTGGLTQLSSDPSLPPLFAYNPEYSDNVELGIKNNFWDNRVQANITIFQSIVRDVQVPTLVLPEALTITRNAGRLQSRGIEAEIEALIARGFSVTYNLGVTHARYTRLDLSQSGNSVDLKGNRQVFTPDMTSLLALQYLGAIDKHLGLTFSIRGEWVYLGTTYFDFANQLKQSPYSLGNLRAGIALKQMELSFWIRNIGDKQYAAYAYEFGAVRLGDPRTYGVSARFRF